MSGQILENPEISPFSVPVGNNLNSRPVCQNNAELHLSHRSLKPLKSSCILPPVLSHLTPETLPEHQYEGRFSEDGSKKSNLGKNSP